MNAQAIGEVLDALAVRFGTTGELLWAALVRQVYVNAATAVVVLAIAFAGIATLAWKHRSLYERLYVNDDEWVVVVLWVVLLISAVASTIAVLVTVPAVFNPNYAALQKAIYLLSTFVP